MSHVYRARTRIGKTVAIKILKGEETDPETRERFYDEARTAAGLNHPNIVSVFDLGEIDGNLFMVMEFLEGKDLSDALTKNELPDLTDQLKILLDVARALRYVHQHGILHRDVKPANVFLCSDGPVKLIDFGIAKSSASVTKTRVGYTVGTLHFMAPEQVQGHADARTDIYAFGLVVYQVLARTLPVKGETVQVVFFNILNQPLDLTPLAPKDLPEGLIQLINDCTQKDPDCRPQTFSEVCARLEAICEQVAHKHAAPPVLPPPVKTTPVPQSLPVATEEPARRGAVRWVLVGVAIAAIAGAIAYWQWDKLRGPSGPVAATLPPLLQHATGDMVLVPQGEFLYGGKNEVRSLPAFYIDKHEVTNAAYTEYCRNKGCQGHAGKPVNPVVSVTIESARSFCEAAGKRLPTALEWEKAARGNSGAPYPWGEDEDTTRANVQTGAKTGEVKPAGAVTAGASPYGALDMSGNVWEFVEEAREPTDEELANAKHLNLTPAASREERWVVVYGGSYAGPMKPVWDGAVIPARYTDETIGFRCAKSAQTTPAAN